MAFEEPRATMISWQFSQATKSTVNVEPVAWLTVGVSFLKFLLESYCKICKLWSWSGLALAKASAFVRTAAGTRQTSKAPLFLVPTLFVPDDPAFSDAASTSSAIPTHKDTSTVLPPPVDGQGEGKTVEVSLCVGLADWEDAAALSTRSIHTEANEGFGFDVRLFSGQNMGTKAITVPEDPLATAKPDKLYGLEIWQYDRAGNCINNSTQNLGNKSIGESFTVPLVDSATLSTPETECQLLIVARGYNGSKNTIESLKGKRLSDIQDMMLDSSVINSITTKDQIKVMPYLLLLPHVCIVKEGETYRIQNPEGQDIRVLLHRLASRLTITWENVSKNTGYVLKQVMLQSIPANYRLLRHPEDKATYPSLLDQYSTLQVPDVEESGSYTCWIPSVLRGESPNATSLYYRTKANAPKGSVYVTLVSQDPVNIKKKLSYRVYLGGSSSHDFNLYDNTNYVYGIKMSHSELPVDDKRITIVNPIGASENNNNLVPTANCFMIVPGGAFCFDPYKYTVDGTADQENSTLKGWADTEGGITSVELLWQTLESGDLGDPVMGIVNTEEDHTNIVDIKRDDGQDITKNPLSGQGQGRIYCRVAPNTTGGSGLIAARNDKGDILWSWHVWVTDYHPDATGDASVDEPETKRKQKYTYGNHPNQYPIMDRNLGALAGYTTIPAEEEDRSKAHGFHYQWGRKDPFPSSYTTKYVSKIERIDLTKSVKNILNLYRPDGVTYYSRKIVPSATTFREAYKDPSSIYKPSGNNADNLSWITNLNDVKQAWGGSSVKTVHDPCPAGWRVTKVENYYPLFNDVNHSATGPSLYLMNMQNNGEKTDGGIVVYFDKEQRRTTYIRYTGYWYLSDQYLGIGENTLLWCRNDVASKAGAKHFRRDYNLTAKYGTLPTSGHLREAIPLRCIQERAN